MTTTTSAGFFLSPQQKHVWSRSATARAQIAVLIEGPLNQDRLHEALHSVVELNEALRTIFQRQTGMKLPFQVVQDALEPAWFTTGFEGDATALMHREALVEMPIDGPQLRSTLFAESYTRSLWVLTAHSAIADATAMQCVVAETLRFYGGATLEAPAEDALRYVQFAQWQNDLLEATDEAAQDAAKFWARPAGEDAPLPFVGESAAKSSAVLEIALSANLEAASAAMGDNVSVSDIVLAAWVAVLARWAGQPRVELGVVFAGREYEELTGLIGTVAKMCPLVASLKPQATFRDLVAQIHADCEEIASVQEYYAPAKGFQVGYEDHALNPPVESAGTRFSTLRVTDAAQDCALKLNALTAEGQLSLHLQYWPDAVSSEVAAGLAESLASVLNAAVAAPDQSVSSLPTMSADRRRQLLSEWNDTEAVFPSCSIHSLVSSVASRFPSSLAVRSGAESLTYAELESRSTRLARHLAKLGVAKGSLVGLCVGRSAEMMVPVLAILKAGAAYVPLSADQPKTRIAQQATGLQALVTEAGFLSQLPEFAGPLVVLDGPDQPWQAESDSALNIEVGSDDLAYVIYTSGSTGTPKGVAVRHGNLVNYATHIVRALELDAAPLQYATVSTLTADLGNTVIYPALLTGGCLHVLPYETATDSRRMADYQQQYPIDVLKIVPSHLTALMEGAGQAVLPRKYLITGGEALKPALVDRIGSACAVINHYGPTETTVGSLMLPLAEWKPTSAATVPLGRPIANTRVYVLDAHRELVPVGVAGELYIAGAGVSAGYIGQPERTAERFVADPFADPLETYATMYRTGDLVRWLPEGVLEFLGRADDQVKIRGFRVELGEIETVLAAQPGVRQSVVVARPRTDGDLQVVAYVVLDRQQAATTDTLKAALKDRLPDYMVPAAFVELARLPLTTNGKVDRKALPAPEERAAKEYQAPATATEELVAQIWTDVLKVQKISTDENFFELGGHSLLATQVISRIRESFQLEVALRTMFEAPVLRNFAAAVDEAKANGKVSVASAPIKRVARQAYRAEIPGK